MVDLEEFIEIFDSKFFRAFNKREYVLGYKPMNENRVLKNLHKDILSGKYKPEPPVKYLYKEKSMGVSRIIPIFSFRDYCVYYFCAKSLSQKLLEHRVSDTFGGWATWDIARDIRKKEDVGVDNNVYIDKSKTLTELEEEVEFEGSEYGFNYDIHSENNYKEYKKYMGQLNAILFAKLDGVEELKNKKCIKLDVQNFYDKINLNILEEKLRNKISKDELYIVDLLFIFLRNTTQNSEIRSIGIPQDLFGDISRTLSFFYLIDYDITIKKIAAKKGADYLRYSDDQWFITSQEDIDLKKLIFIASIELDKLNLGINQLKVVEYTVEELEEKNRNSIYKQIHENSIDINTFCSENLKLIQTQKCLSNEDIMFLAYLKTPCSENEDGRIKFDLLNTYFKSEVESLLIRKDFLLRDRDLKITKKIFESVKDTTKFSIIEKLINISEEYVHTYFHYNLYDFFKSNDFIKEKFKQKYCRKINKRIKNIEKSIKNNKFNFSPSEYITLKRHIDEEINRQGEEAFDASVQEQIDFMRGK